MPADLRGDRLEPGVEARLVTDGRARTCDVTGARLGHDMPWLHVGDPDSSSRHPITVSLAGLPAFQALLVGDRTEVFGRVEAHPSPVKPQPADLSPRTCIMCGDNVADLDAALKLTVAQFTAWLHDDCRRPFAAVLDRVYERGDEYLPDVI